MTFFPPEIRVVVVVVVLDVVVVREVVVVVVVVLVVVVVVVPGRTVGCGVGRSVPICAMSVFG